MQSNKKGFTIVEFLIAITIFTVAVMLIMGAVVFIGRKYQKGVNQVAIEDASRTVHQNITDAIKLQAKSRSIITVDNGPWRALCIGNAKYVFPVSANAGMTQDLYITAPAGLWVQYGFTVCDTDRTTATNLIPDGAKVTKFQINNDAGNGLYRVETNIIKAEYDLLDPLLDAQGNLVCQSGLAGREFCANVNIKSYAARRTL